MMMIAATSKSSFLSSSKNLLCSSCSCVLTKNLYLKIRPALAPLTSTAAPNVPVLRQRYLTWSQNTVLLPKSWKKCSTVLINSSDFSSSQGIFVLVLEELSSTMRTAGVLEERKDPSQNHDCVQVWYEPSKDFSVLSDVHHLFLCLSLMIIFLSKKVERLRVHKRFDQPNTNMLYKVLNRSKLLEPGCKTHQNTESITQRCLQCQRIAKALRRFELNLQNHKNFNHTTFVYMFYIGKNFHSPRGCRAHPLSIRTLPNSWFI